MYNVYSIIALCTYSIITLCTYTQCNITHPLERRKFCHICSNVNETREYYA